MIVMNDNCFHFQYFREPMLKIETSLTWDRICLLTKCFAEVRIESYE